MQVDEYSLQTHPPEPLQVLPFLQHVSCVQVDDFGLQLQPLGPLQELSLSLQEGPLHRGWQCKVVVVEDTAAGVVTYFWCDRWADTLQLLGNLTTNQFEQVPSEQLTKSPVEPAASPIIQSFETWCLTACLCRCLFNLSAPQQAMQ